MDAKTTTTTAALESAVWAAIDDVAEKAGLTASALAMKSGLDATIFNRSKRSGRTPNFRSVIRACGVAGVSMGEFGKLVDQHAAGGGNV